jgi:hypothetical protein
LDYKRTWGSCDVMKDWEDYEKERKDQIVSNIKRKGKYEE